MTDPIRLDSVTHLTSAHRGRALYAGSHGGVYAGYFAATMGVGAVILNDAGVGRDRAGLAGVDLLGRLGVPAATIAHDTARIGDGADGLARGRVSFVNPAAAACGVMVAMPARAALEHLDRCTLGPSPAPPPIAEARFEIEVAGERGIRVVGVDSITLVRPEDRGQVVVCGSHGGLLGGRAASAIKIDVHAVVFNDAGGGIDGAGFTRLPALDTRHIAAACVSCFSARIGDGRSTWDHGYISAINETAKRHGALVGQSCRDFVMAMIVT